MEIWKILYFHIFQPPEGLENMKILSQNIPLHISYFPRFNDASSKIERGKYKSLAENINLRAENIKCVQIIQIESGEYKSISENMKARAENMKCVRKIQTERGEYKSIAQNIKDRAENILLLLLLLFPPLIN